MSELLTSLAGEMSVLFLIATAWGVARDWWQRAHGKNNERIW